MRSAGYTLIELLVVITIIALLSVVGFVNFKDFSANQVAVKAAGEVQSALRLAQSNATSSTLCDNLGSLSWTLIFILVSGPAQGINLNCRNSSTSTGYRNYSFEAAEISSITGSSGSGCSGRYVELTYSVSTGTLTFFDVFDNCIKNSNSLTITVRNKNKTTLTKDIIIYKGGRIDVQ